MEILVVGSKVKEYIKGKDCRTSGEVIEALSKQVAKLLDDAVMRCKGNSRTTVKAQDL